MTACAVAELQPMRHARWLRGAVTPLEDLVDKGFDTLITRNDATVKIIVPSE